MESTLDHMHHGQRHTFSDQFRPGRNRDYAPEQRLYHTVPNDRRPPPDGPPLAPSVIARVLSDVFRALSFGAWEVAAAALDRSRSELRLACSDEFLVARKDGPVLRAAACWQICRLVEVWLKYGSLQAARHALLVRKTDESFVAVELRVTDPVQRLPLASETVSMLTLHGVKRVGVLAERAEQWAASPKTMPEVLRQQEALHDIAEVLRLIGLAGPRVMKYITSCGDKNKPWKGGE